MKPIPAIVYNCYKFIFYKAFIFKNTNFVFCQRIMLAVIEDILQGRVQSPTGGESPRIPSDRDRSGVIPGPTVKVWMEEEFLMDDPF
jgi:hypothetical protein